MRNFLIAFAVVAACGVEGGKDVPPVKGEGAVVVDPVTQTVTVDTNQIPVVPACEPGQVVHRDATGEGWECAFVTWDSVTDKPSLAAGGHTHPWDSVTAKPELAPAVHTHGWDAITDPPAGGHSHPVADVQFPQGTVLLFALGACPPSWSPMWSQLTQAQGRAIVGLPSGGTPLATVPASGGALVNQGTRTISGAAGVLSHTHPITPGSISFTPGTITGTIAGAGAHTHAGGSVTVGTGGSTNHSHTASSGNQSANHHHSMSSNNGAAGTVANCANTVGCTSSPYTANANHTHSVTVNGADISHGHTGSTFGTTGAQTASHAHTVSASMTGGTASMASASSSAPSGSSASMDVTMPYVQLVVCVKN